VPRLVALDIPGGPLFLDVLRRLLDAGEAVLPIDQRLGVGLQRALLDELRPAAVIDASGTERSLEGAWPTEPGDALVVATSGTTGKAKGVVLTMDAVRASALATSARLNVDPEIDRWCCCLPLAHVGGLSILTRSIVTGTGIEVLPRFDAVTVLEAATKRRATLVSLVPTTLRRLGDAGASAYRAIVLGGSAPPVNLAPHVVTTYGMTETGSGVVYDGVPLDGVDVRIGDDGGIALRGPMLLRCYRDGSDPKDADGWLSTGDAGELDADGRLTVHGRMVDLVISGGENVWPEQVEAALLRHEGVAQVAVAGAPDPEWGERVVAYVVVSEPGSPPPLEELRELATSEIGPWAAPRELVIVGELPRTAIGKVRRAQLTSLVTSRSGASEGPSSGRIMP